MSSKPKPINFVQNYTSKAENARIQLYFYDNFTSFFFFISLNLAFTSNYLLEIEKYFQRGYISSQSLSSPIH